MMVMNMVLLRRIRCFVREEDIVHQYRDRDISRHGVAAAIILSLPDCLSVSGVGDRLSLLTREQMASTSEPPDHRHMDIRLPDDDVCDQPPTPVTAPKVYKRRKIAIKFLYLGWDFDGLVTQETMNNTIEDHLFRALMRTKMIDDRDSCDYHRSGRTDIGVSAFCQVVSLVVRSSGREDDELNYPFLLNKVLPAQIRCLCWSPVVSEFTARFSCKQRTYKYFFPRSHLRIQEMRTAVGHLIGEHDFRNFCKLDDNNCDKTIRQILSAEITDCDSSAGDTSSNPYDLLCVTISARGFLWHQIRCILSLLFLVGEGKEQPDLIRDMLDTDIFPHKPQYQLASGLPLVLYDCLYDDTDVDWVVDQKALTDVVASLQSLWTQAAIKTQMIRQMITDVNLMHPLLSEVRVQHECLTMEKSKKSHKKIRDRPVSHKYPHHS